MFSSARKIPILFSLLYFMLSGPDPASGAALDFSCETTPPDLTQQFTCSGDRYGEPLPLEVEACPPPCAYKYRSRTKRLAAAVAPAGISAKHRISSIPPLHNGGPYVDFYPTLKNLSLQQVRAIVLLI